MKKANQKTEGEMRAEYKRSDFGKMVRGKYHKQVIKSSNVVVLNADVAKAFPNSTAVNEALGQLLTLAKSSVRLTSRSTRTPQKRGAG